MKQNNEDNLILSEETMEEVLIQKEKVKVQDGMTPEEVVDYVENVKGFHKVLTPSRVEYAKLSKNPGKVWDRNVSTVFNSSFEHIDYDVKIEGFKNMSFPRVYGKHCDYYEGYGFDPTTTNRRLPDNTLNAFKGFAFKGIKGDVSPFLKLIDITYGFSNKRNSDYLLSFLADIVQDPANKKGTALSIFGGEGGWKSGPFDMLGEIIGDEYIFTAQTKNHLTGQFTNHLVNKLITMGAEVSYGGANELMDILKEFITNSFRSVEGKGIDIETYKDYSRIVLTTNGIHSINITKKNRRWSVLEANPAMSKEERLNNPTGEAAVAMDDMWAWWNKEDNSGKEALMYYLLNYNINVDLTKVHKNKELLMTIDMSMSTEELFLYSIAEGYLDEDRGFNSPIIKCETTVKSAEIYEAYHQWCKDNGNKFVQNKKVFGAMMTNIGLPSRKSGVMVYDIPTGEDLLKLIEAK